METPCFHFLFSKPAQVSLTPVWGWKELIQPNPSLTLLRVTPQGKPPSNSGFSGLFLEFSTTRSCWLQAGKMRFESTGSKIVPLSHFGGDANHALQSWGGDGRSWGLCSCPGWAFGAFSYIKNAQKNVSWRCPLGLVINAVLKGF